MTIRQGAFAPVVHLDLRRSASGLGSAKALREHTLAQLEAYDLPEPDDQRFLVVDTPEGLIANEAVYEHIMNYHAVGEIRVLCLVLGSLPPSGPETAPADRFAAERVLVRPALLRSSTSGLLWVGDLRSARTARADVTHDDPVALAVLVDLLVGADLFDEVLDVLAPLPDAAAAPGIQVLEQDLSVEVRDRAWQEALLRFAGNSPEDQAGYGEGSAESSGRAGADLPKPLADLLLLRSGGRRDHRVPGGAADNAYHRCADALLEAETTLLALTGFQGLLSRGSAPAFESDLEDARAVLDEYRQLVELALGADTATAGPQSADGSGVQLARLGLRVPPSDGVGDRIGEGLRQLVERLLGEGMALRAAAERFTRLSGQVEPLPGVTLLPRLDAYTPDRIRQRSARQSVRPVQESIGRSTLFPFLAGVLGGLWVYPMTPLALLVPALLWGGARLMATRLPGAPATRGRALATGAWTLTGAVLAAVAGTLTHPPVWAGAIGLLLGLGTVLALLQTGWRNEAYSWGQQRGVPVVQEALDELDELLAQAVLERWAADERLYCADAARSVAGVLRATADAAQQEASRRRGSGAGGFGGAGGRADGGSEVDDDWLTTASPLESEAFDRFEAVNGSAGAAPADSAAGAGRSGPGDGTGGAGGTAGGNGSGGGGRSGGGNDGGNGGGAVPVEDWTRQFAWADRPGPDDARPDTDPGSPMGGGFGAGLGGGLGSGLGDGLRGDSFNDAADRSDRSDPRSGTAFRPDGSAAPTAAAHTPRWLERVSGEGGPELVATLAGDLTDATITALTPYLGAVERGQAGAAAQDRITERVRALLSEAREHLHRNGVVPAPPFAAAHRTRPPSASLLGVNAVRVAETAGPEADRRQVVQLCTAEQAALLNRDPSKAVWLRFAPQTVREEVEGGSGIEDLSTDTRAVWMFSGRYAGLLRLVPLSGGVVRNVRRRHGGSSPGDDLTDGRDRREGEQE